MPAALRGRTNRCFRLKTALHVVGRCSTAPCFRLKEENMFLLRIDLPTGLPKERKHNVADLLDFLGDGSNARVL